MATVEVETKLEAMTVTPAKTEEEQAGAAKKVRGGVPMPGLGAYIP